MTLWVNVPCPDEKLVPSVAKSKFGLVVLYLHVSILVGGYCESCRGGGSRKYCSVAGLTIVITGGTTSGAKLAAIW